MFFLRYSSDSYKTSNTLFKTKKKTNTYLTVHLTTGLQNLDWFYKKLFV